MIAFLLIFGPNKLPELGQAFGRTLREFKNATKGMLDGDQGEVEVHQEEKVVTPKTSNIELKYYGSTMWFHN